MNKKVLLIIIVLVGIISSTCYLKSNHARVNAKAEMVIDKVKKENLLKVWGPYGYYALTWTVQIQDDEKYMVSGKGRSRFSSFGTLNFINNYYHLNKLPLGIVNHTLQKMKKEQPYLIWLSSNDRHQNAKREFLMITKDPKLYDNNQQLIELAKKVANPNAQPTKH